jgi:hypothetical protein
MWSRIAFLADTVRVDAIGIALPATAAGLP